MRKFFEKICPKFCGGFFRLRLTGQLSYGGLVCEVIVLRLKLYKQRIRNEAYSTLSLFQHYK